MLSFSSIFPQLLVFSASTGISLFNDLKSWIFLPQHGQSYSVLDAYSLETIRKQWRPWRELLEFTIEPCADLDQTVALYC